MKRTTAEVVSDFLNIGQVKRVLRVGSDIFGVIVPFVEKPTVWNGLKAAFTIGKIIVEDVEVWPDSFFDEGWSKIYSDAFTTLIVGALNGKPTRVMKTSEESWVINIVQVDDVKFAYSIAVKTGHVDFVYVESDKVDKAKKIIKEELWRMMKRKNVVLTHDKKRSNEYTNVSEITVDEDDNVKSMKSKRSETYSKYLKKCIDAGVSRSVMLYGPPGTGKSTMAKAIIDELGMRSFRIRVTDLDRLNQQTMFDAIDLFEPDAVILDDFDRSDSQSSILESLEFFQRHVKLVVATVNKKSRLDHAVIRPGRFDELVCVKKLDDDVIRHVLGEENADLFDSVCDWPIAFINELRNRFAFQTKEEAVASVKELALRVKQLEKYEDEDELESIRTSSED